MDSVILILLEHDNLTDRDTLNLLSTCRTFRNLLDRVWFTERHYYDSILTVPYAYRFANLLCYTSDSLKGKPYIKNIKCLSFGGDTLDYIPKNVETLWVPYYCKIECKVPKHTVVQHYVPFIEGMAKLVYSD